MTTDLKHRPRVPALRGGHVAASRATLAALAALLVLGAAAVPAAAQNQVKAPPVRPIGPVLSRSAEPLGAVSTVLPLPGGKVLVNDILHRRVVMFDSTLTEVRVIADSTSATANAYGARGGGLLSYHGDSALFIDPASLSMMVVNANGELAGVRAVPRATEIGLLVGGPNGRPGFDGEGRMIDRGQARARPAAQAAAARAGARAGGGGAGGGPGGGNFALQPDSAPIVRVDLRTRKLDTLAMIKIPRVDVRVTQGADGRPNISTTINPLPTTDDWALMSDGTVAVVRGHDFHVDWIAADGSTSSSPKILFEWQRLSDEDKEMIIDSARTALERRRAEADRLTGGRGGIAAVLGGEAGAGPGGGGALGGGPGGGGRGAAGGFGGAGGGQRGGGAGGGEPNPQRRGDGPGGGEGPRAPTINMVSPSDLPDYRPPFGQQAALGDADGLLWVRSSAPVGEGGPIYYVISRQNEVVDRIQLPQGRMIAGFGKGGVVYMAFRDTEGNNRVETARWK
ncbi:MAG: hypothetical protein KJZ74_14190 [Gemmatimonadales bacterium]|nr:hypothetical protein [Gemmatimonadales bacterium]